MKSKLAKQANRREKSQLIKHSSLPKEQNFISQSFHLKEPEEAQNAKNDLFLEAENFDTSQDRKAFNKTHHHFHRSEHHGSLDSWHGQPLNNSSNPEKPDNKMNKNPLKQSKMPQKKIDFLEHRRSFLQSALQLKDNKRKIQEMKRSLQGLYSLIPTSKKILTLSPASNNLGESNISKELSNYHKRKRPIKSAYASLRTSKQAVTFSPSRFQYDTGVKSSSINLSQTNKLKYFAMEPEGISQTIVGKHGNRGLFGSVVKSKNQKKGKWIEMKSKISNISRVYQVNNSNLRGDIGKIINLINEEDRIEHSSTNFQ